MNDTPQDFWGTLQRGLSCKCPKCGKGNLFQSGFFALDLLEKCDSCGFDYSKNDSADGPAVFLIFILGTAIVPLALLVEYLFHPPLWVHAVTWTIVVLGLTVGSLKPLKSYVIYLQYKHRPGDWKT